MYKNGKSLLKIIATAAALLLIMTSCKARGDGNPSAIPRRVVSGGTGSSSGTISRLVSSAVSSSSAQSQASSSEASSAAASSAEASSAAAADGSKTGGSKTGGGTTHTTTPAAPAAPAEPAAPSWPSGGAVPYAVSIPAQDGSSVAGNDQVAVDLSYTSYGFIKVRMKTPSSQRMKVMITLGSTYTYDLDAGGGTDVYPLQMGSGSYTVSVWQNISGSSYAQIYSTTASASLMYSTIPFLVPSQMVNYSQGSSAASIARSLVSGKSNNFERVSAVLTYVASNISYDYGEASSVQSGYVPNVDSVLARRKGICFDYAAVTAAMLRSLGYPTKLITGYAKPNNVYHAWNEVYFSNTGWVKVMDVQVTAGGWSRVDTTFISTAKGSTSIQSYVNNGGNYTKKLTY